MSLCLFQTSNSEFGDAVLIFSFKLLQRRIQQFEKGGVPFDENQYVQNSSFVNKQGLFKRFPCGYNCI